MRSRIEPLLLFLVAMTIYWLGNSEVSLWDRDEPRYAETAREMVQSGDYVVPYFNGQFRFQKPVLTYWLVAGMYKLLGETAFAARALSGVSVALSCLIVWRLGDRMFGKPVGKWAAWMLALCPTYVLLGKLCIPDGPQLLFGTICFAALFETCKPNIVNEVSARRWAFAFWISLGASVLVKGPIIAGMLGFTILLQRVLSGVKFTDYQLRWRLGFTLLVLTAAPWMIAIRYCAGDGFYAESLGNQVVRRVAVSFDGRLYPPGYYAITTLAGLAPCLAVVLGAVWAFRKQWRRQGPISFLFAWALGPMILLELFRSKQMHYYAPAYPAFGLLAAAWLKQLLTVPQSKFASLPKWCSLMCGILTAMPLALFAAFCLGICPQPVWIWIACCSAIVIPMFATFLFLRQGKLNLSLNGMTVCWSIGWVFVAGLLLPSMERQRIVRPVADRLAVHSAKTGLPVVSHQFFEPSLIFYSNLRIPDFYQEPDFRMVVEGAARDLIVPMTQGEFDVLSQRYPGRLTVLESHRGWVKMHRDVVHIVRLAPSIELARR